MARRTIQEIQQQRPWIMWPTVVIDVLLTPRRWAGPFSGLATAVSNLLTSDSRWIARVINACFGWLSGLRSLILRDRPLLMRIAWTIRKSIWSVTWAFIVVMRLWPRRVRIRRRDNAIRLIPAPESYPDFQSPTLVVPSDVPKSELTLPGAITVQVLHVLQDVYPVIAPHQPEAAEDPAQRLRDAYSWVYRMVRHPPTWHRELEDARRKGSLLGMLAVGGPFAKLLERKSSQSQEYLIDLQYLARYQVREELAPLGCQIHFTQRGSSLEPSAIDYAGQRYTPGDTRWSFVQRVALCTLATHTTVWRHGMQYHVGGVAPFAVMTHQLPSFHPVRRLLAPHIADTLSTNFHTHLTLRRSGFDVTGFSFDYDTILRYYDDGASYFDLKRLDPRGDTASRGIHHSVEYPYLRQADRYMSMFEGYVRDYIDHYYLDEAALAQDSALKAWFDGLEAQVVRGVTGYVSALTKTNLVKLCATFIYSVSFEHEDNTMWNYAMFLPATVRKDGARESVGQVQSVLNFEMVIASAANKLMRDASYLALDPQGAAIMHRFQRHLAALQEQMADEPNTHWRILPADLEASVSA